MNASLAINGPYRVYPTGYDGYYWHVPAQNEGAEPMHCSEGFPTEEVSKGLEEKAPDNNPGRKTPQRVAGPPHFKKQIFFCPVVGRVGADLE